MRERPFEAGGVDPDQLAALAGGCGLNAEARQIDLETIAELVAMQRFPIVLVDRSVLDDEFSVHAVVVIRVSSVYVRVLDPLRGERRITIRKFDQASRRTDRWAVTWNLQGE